MDVSFVQNTKYESVCTKLMISQVDIWEGFTKKVARILDFVGFWSDLGPLKRRRPILEYWQHIRPAMYEIPKTEKGLRYQRLFLHV